MIFLQEPEGFDPYIDVAGCFIEHEGKIVLLHRDAHRPQGNTWGAPGGKIAKKEDVRMGLQREVQEETGYLINLDEVNHVNTFYVKYPELNFIYHLFHYRTTQRPEIILNSKEHTDFLWVTPGVALTMTLIPDEDFCIKYFYKDSVQ